MKSLIWGMILASALAVNAQEPVKILDVDKTVAIPLCVDVRSSVDMLISDEWIIQELEQYLWKIEGNEKKDQFIRLYKIAKETQWIDCNYPAINYPSLQPIEAGIVMALWSGKMDDAKKLAKLNKDLQQMIIVSVPKKK